MSEAVATSSDADILARLTNYVGSEPPADEPAPAPRAQQPPKVLQQQPEQAQAQPEPEQQEPAQEEPAPEQSQEESEGQITIDPDAPLMEITTKAEGGKDVTRAWTLNEMKQAVMMREDYNRKTAELAKARDQMSQEVEQQLGPQRQQYVQNLQFLQAAVQSLVLPEMQGADLEKLADASPAEFVKLQAKAQRTQAALNQIQQQIHAATQEQQVRQAEHSKRMLTDPIQGIPEWGPEKYSAIINDGAKHYGFQPEEVAQVVDYRMIKVLNDALAYRKIASAKPEITKKVTIAPKALKPGAVTDSADAQAHRMDVLQKQHKKDGSVESAAALYMAMSKRRK